VASARARADPQPLISGRSGTAARAAPEPRRRRRASG
jgi:hypothetical protein